MVNSLIIIKSLDIPSSTPRKKPERIKTRREKRRAKRDSEALLRSADRLKLTKK